MSQPDQSVHFSRKDCLAGIAELYTDFCKLSAQAEGLTSFSLPDFETMLEQLRQRGLPPAKKHAVCFINTCPGCGGPGQKYRDESDYHCPNSFCAVRTFRPRVPASPRPEPR
ncbi:MAG: hypothetical protein FD161_3019 [Limisphaerales bacterium]|nr:MAG: hypothetical protein FD161_3019 [Limisphaerales bacterium]KAG0508132.1 MAG: hypothetical protein E1N63_2726 [Limisphaerales bacterium]TXT53015.1 MAG: hypothetical protein FD140_123 [Limisphaerales bacterium]